MDKNVRFFLVSQFLFALTEHLAFSVVIVPFAGPAFRRTTQFHGGNVTHDFAHVFYRAVSQDLDSFRRQAYAVQNCYRRIHGAGPCNPSSALETSSQNWANHLANTGSFQHSSSSYGENLFQSSGNVDGSTAIVAWYGEQRNYDYSNPGFSSNTGHFTQLVWKGSTSCGISFAEGRGGTVIVANYDQPGNSGRYRENVGAPNSGGGEDCASVGGGGGGGRPPAQAPSPPSPAPPAPAPPSRPPSRPPPSSGRPPSGRPPYGRPPPGPSRPPSNNNDNCYYANDGSIYCPNTQRWVTNNIDRDYYD